MAAAGAQQSKQRNNWWKLVALTAAIPVVCYVYAYNASDGFRTQFEVVTSVDPARLEPRGTIVDGLWYDVAFIASWSVIVVLLWFGRRWLPPFRRRLWYRQAWLIAAAALVLDALEDVVLRVALDQHPKWLLVALATIAWVKVLAYAAALFAALVVIVGATIGRELTRLLEWLLEASLGEINKTPRDIGSEAVPAAGAAITPPDLSQAAATESWPKTAICVSGGGLRAAAVALGALRALDRPPGDGQPSIFRSARWLSAVSGGAYTACGWRASRQHSDATITDPVVTEEHDGLFDESSPWWEFTASHHLYPMNGFLSLAGGLVSALVRSALVLSAVLAFPVSVGWLAGLFVGSDIITKNFDELVYSTSAGTALDRQATWADFGPGVVLLGLGILLFVAINLVPQTVEIRVHRQAVQARNAAFGLMGIGAFLVLLIMGLPLLLRYDASMLGWLYNALTPSSDANATKNAGSGAKLLGLIGTLGIVSALVGYIKAQAKKRWLRLGGVLLAVVMFVIFDVVAHQTAQGKDIWGSFLDLPGIVWGAILALLLVNAIATHRLTMSGMYRKRLAETFITGTTSKGVQPIPYQREEQWSTYPQAAGPSLVTVLTVHSSKETFGGLKGYGMIFDQESVTLYDKPHYPALGSTVAAAAYPGGSWLRGFPRHWSVSRSMALSGAAFASAMGRAALGTTNALLAATNLRLGMWIPNPRFAKRYFIGVEPCDQPRVGLGYLAKEILGRYDPIRDPFVYAADGGHRENLGLVEMLRLQPTRIFAVDASGDATGNFTTLKEAIELAETELGVIITMDWGPIGRPDDHSPNGTVALPKSSVTTGQIQYADDSAAVLYYARYQVSEESSQALRHFQAEHPEFPLYGLGDQFLKSPRFERLVLLGEEIGDALVRLATTP